MPYLIRIISIALLTSFALLLAGCASVNSQSTQLPLESTWRPDKITTFLMFEGRAEEAMLFYTSLFDDSEILSITRFGPDLPGKEGTVYQAMFTLAGRPFMAFDSPAPHNFSFTPSISLFVLCETEEELDRLYAKLIEGGEAAMPLGDYGFSRKYGWVVDRFGVSWQLNLPFE
ncbi:MAG TPA: VOC family protein [Phycisphaerales bacterium]|nr:VOC family protein [Phycisphaerales bacterium]HRQ75104.1 VOC family protein [Phycisphaerales bacterium]